MSRISNFVSGAVVRVDDESLECRRVASIDRWACRIVSSVADKDLSLLVVERVARAVVDGRIDGEAVDELLGLIRVRRASGEIKVPGAYFVSSMKRIFAAHGVRWR